MQTGELSIAELDDLRSELAKAIEIRTAADGRAKIAKQTANRARIALTAAQDALGKIEAEADRADKTAIARHARTISEALRGNSPVPAINIVPVPDTATLDRARAQASALEAAYDELLAEAQAAECEANARAAEVRTAAEAIAEAEARRLHLDMVAARDTLWALEERLSGFHLRDDRRIGGPKFQALKEAAKRQLDRRAHIVALRPELIETPKFNDYLDGVNAAQERAWADYVRRLETDPAAEFEER